MTLVDTCQRQSLRDPLLSAIGLAVDTELVSNNPTARPLVSAVVVNLGQRDLLRSCLASLSVAMRPLPAGEVIVVDNASRDGSVAMVKAEFPGVHVIELGHNSGFAGGVGIGVRSANGEWILCINNDATVGPDAVVELLRVAESGGERVGSVAALMVFADRPGVINSAGIEVDRLGIASDRLLGEPVEASEVEPVDVFGTSAGAALYRRAMLEEVPFDESFFAYYEDVDVALASSHAWMALPLRSECCGPSGSPLGDVPSQIVVQVLLVGTQSRPCPRSQCNRTAASTLRNEDAALRSRVCSGRSQS